MWSCLNPLQAFRDLAKQSTTLVLPANTADPASMVAQAMGIYKSLSGPGAAPAYGDSLSTAPPSGGPAGPGGGLASAKAAAAAAKSFSTSAGAARQAARDQAAPPPEFVQAALPNSGGVEPPFTLRKL